jgi:hypothetical protein
MKTRSANGYVEAYGKTIEFFRNRGFNIKIQRIDNETSNTLEVFLKKTL